MGLGFGIKRARILAENKAGIYDREGVALPQSSFEKGRVFLDREGRIQLIHKGVLAGLVSILLETEPSCQHLVCSCRSHFLQQPRSQTIF